MAADKVTLTLNPDTLARARAAAEAQGMSLSAWMDRAARRAALVDAGRQHQAWLDANPDIREELDAFVAWAERSAPGWSDLGEAA